MTMSHTNPIEAAAIPPHMLDRLTSAAQRKAFGHIADGEDAPKPAAKKHATKKAAKKRAKQSE